MARATLSWIKAGLMGLTIFGTTMMIQAHQTAQAMAPKVVIVVCADQDDPDGFLVEEVSPPEAGTEGADCGTTLDELLGLGYQISSVNSATGGPTGRIVHVVYTLTNTR